jgi:GMP synthase (glutamine-hydrolysing)
VEIPVEQPRILMVRHSRNWEQDRCSQWLECQGCTLDYVCPALGEALPNIEDYSAAIVFGGVQSANDCDHCQWMRDEMCWIEQFMSLQRPLLGICLGAQLIARTLGATVNRHPEQQHEIGFCPLYPADEHPSFIPPGQLMFQWHNEGFELPEGAQLLARGDQFHNQAFRYNNHVTGLQFHPEANHAVIQCWQEASATDNSARCDQTPASVQLQQAHQLDEPITLWLQVFLNNWLSQAPQPLLDSIP